MDKKVFKTLEEQINILKEKGLVITNEDYTKEILFRENYFFLHGYRRPFLQSRNLKNYIKGTSFEELYSLFLFDRQLRNILFKNILVVENNIKSIFSYELSKKYGYREKEYLNPCNFNETKEKRKQVNDLLGKMKRQIEKNVKGHSATMHYVDNYGYIPLWVLVKVLSFGIVCELFSILKKEDQYNIVDVYNLDISIFSNYLSVLSNYRNICAHEDIVYDNRSYTYIADTKYHRLLNIPIINNEYMYGKNDLFSVIIILKSLLNKEEFKSMLLEINNAISNLELNIKSIPITKILDRMGFPLNYLDLIDIEDEIKNK